MDNIIEIRNLTYEYNKDAGKVLDGITMDIGRGSFVAVVGQNGSGKSTLAKMMNAILVPDDGTVKVNGMLTSGEDNTWDIRKTVGMVFQNPDNQLVSAIVEDDVAFGPENIGMEPDKIRELVDEALDSVHMGQYADKVPHLLSGGQKQRIAIAGIIAMRPECIVFDEPTAMLDPRGRDDVMNIIEKLHKEGMTIVLITHFMDEAVKADKIVVMDGGRAVLTGTPREVFSERETVEKAGLELPVAIDIALRLKEKGVALDDDILTGKELVESICRSK